MEKFNFLNSKYTLEIYFMSKIYESFGYDLFRFDGKSIDDSEDFFENVVMSSNRGIVIRFYNEYDLPLSFFKEQDISEFKNIPTYDFLLSFRNSNIVKYVYSDLDGFYAYLKGRYYLDISEEALKQFFSEHKAVIAGFYGSNEEGYFFSPLKGYEEFNPKTWTYLRSHHDIKIV